MQRTRSLKSRMREFRTSGSVGGRERQLSWPTRQNFPLLSGQSQERKYTVLAASDLKRMRELESENSRLKRMYADLSLENEALKDLILKYSDAIRSARSREVSCGGEGARSL